MSLWKQKGNNNTRVCELLDRVIESEVYGSSLDSSSAAYASQSIHKWHFENHLWLLLNMFIDGFMHTVSQPWVVAVELDAAAPRCFSLCCNAQPTPPQSWAAWQVWVVDIDSCGRGRLFRSFGVLLLQFLLNTKNWITWQGDKEWKLCFVTGQFFRRAMLHSPRQKRPFFEHCLCPLLTAPIDSFVHGISQSLAAMAFEMTVVERNGFSCSSSCFAS